MTATTTTVNDLDPVVQYTATAGQTIFDAPWLFFEDADLTVYHTLSGVDADDTADLLTLTTDYTVTDAGVQAGGTVVLNTGAAVGDIITIYRVVNIERTADYQTSGDMLAETLNKEQDTEIMISQQIRADVNNRAFLLQRSEDVNITTKIPTPEATKVWGWNATGDGIEYYNNPDDAVTAAAASAAAALVSETNAAASEAGAEAIFDAFDDAYLGSKASDPTLDNDGNALADGALYYNTSSNDLRVYDLGTTTWIVFPTTTISALTDVTLTSIASGELLKWNGSQWINQTLTEAGIQALLSVVSQADAEAGTATDSRIWTAERVGQAIAALASIPTTLGDIGTYAFLSQDTLNTAIAQGSTYAGSSLDYAGFLHDNGINAQGRITTTSPSGTWRAMGYCAAVSGFYSTTVFVRIS